MNKTVIAAVACLPLYSGALMAEGSYSIALGADYSNGDYDTGSNATLWSFPLALNYEAETWGWGITVPYLILRSSGNVVVGSGGMIGTRSDASAGSGGMGSSATNTTTESGLGDIILRGSFELTEGGAALPWLGLTLKAKLATADENDLLGTGENDYAAQLEMVKGMVNGYVGYKYLGDPAYVDFNNVAYGALAVSHDSSDATRLTLEGYLEQASIDGNDPKREVSVIVRHTLDDKRRLGAYLLKGFSDASPDWGAGVALKYSL